MTVHKFSRAVGLIVVLATLVACSGDDEQAAIGPLPDSVTFAQHIAPIAYGRCVVCHRPGGYSPFSLLTYDDFRTYGPAVVQAIRSGRMPPWLPAPGEYPFMGDRRLDAQSKALIERWVEQGMALGDSTALPDEPEFPEGWPMGEPDLVVTMAEPFVVPAEGEDRFRNFVIPLPLAEGRFVRAVDLLSGRWNAIHHAVIQVDPTDGSRRADALDPGPGFDAMILGSDAAPPGGFLLGWTPGRVPDRGSEDLAWQLEPGTDVVLQLHMRPRGEEQSVQASVGFYFADDLPTQIPHVVTLMSRRIDLIPGKRNYEVQDDFVLPVPVRVLGLYPHAHYLGKRIVGTAELPSGDVTTLLEIPDWDFNQQDTYRFVDPVALPAGTRLRMLIAYDNTADNPRNPSSPPRRVTYGPGSADEMANLWIQVLVQDSNDLAILERDLVVDYTNDLLADLQFLTEMNPGDAATQFELAQTYRQVGAPDRAAVHYRRALAARSDFTDARYGLALILHEMGQLDDALQLYLRVLEAEPDRAAAHFRVASIFHEQGDLVNAVRGYVRAVELDPDRVSARNELGNALAELGQPLDALAQYEQVLVLDPDNPDAHNNIGNLLFEAGEIREAVSHYRGAVAARPGFALTRFNYGRALIALGEVSDGLRELREATRIEPGWPVPWAMLAWTLATDADPAHRDSVEAVAAGEEASRLAGVDDPNILDALAAAYASAGRFDVALDAAQRALAMVGSNTSLRSALELRVDLYRAARPYRQPAR